MRSRKRQRLWLVSIGVLLLGAATALALTAFEDNLVFFHSPTDIQAGKAEAGRMIRVGGLVVDGSVQKVAGSPVVGFTLTDGEAEVVVSYTGILPDLFREGQGIVAQGKLLQTGQFEAVEVLAKHDENYMPPEVAEALKKSGHWKMGQEADQGAGS